MVQGQMIAVRKVCGEYLAKWKDVFGAFIDLEKAYDTIDQRGKRRMLRVYGVE